MMHYPSFRFAPIFERFSNSMENLNFKHFTFSQNILRFSSAKISDDLFLVIDDKFRISRFPLFSLFQYPPGSRKLLFPPTLTNFPSVFEKFTCFLHTLCVFRFPRTLTMMHLCITQCTYWTPLPTTPEKHRS